MGAHDGGVRHALNGGPEPGPPARSRERRGRALCVRAPGHVVVRPTACSVSRHGTIFSRRFGEAVPGLVTLPVVALFTRAVATCAGVADVWFAR